MGHEVDYSINDGCDTIHVGPSQIHTNQSLRDIYLFALSRNDNVEEASKCARFVEFRLGWREFPTQREDRVVGTCGSYGTGWLAVLKSCPRINLK